MGRILKLSLSLSLSIYLFFSRAQLIGIQRKIWPASKSQNEMLELARAAATGSTTCQTSDRQVVGKWFNSLDIYTQEMVWARGKKDIPISTCSLPCEPGMIKKQQGDTCCWVCDQCEAYEFVYDEYTCMDCGLGFWPHPDKRGCYRLPVNHIRYTHTRVSPQNFCGVVTRFTQRYRGVFLKIN